MSSRDPRHLLSIALGSSLSRRALLKGLGGAAGLGLVGGSFGCGGDGGGGGDGPDGGPGSAESFFEVLEEVRAALRQSPDHLIQRADDLVAARDVEGLFELVRDRIVTVPTGHRTYSRPAVGVRWGARATLRGGAGTPREKADLLRDLYVRAGFAAEVVAGRLLDGSDAPSWTLRPIDRPFAPAVDDATLERWRAALGLSGAPTSVPEIDPSGAEADALADALLPLVSADDFGASAFDWRASAIVPVVRVEVDGEVRYANPILPDAVFGTSYLLPQDENLPADDAEDLLEIEVILATATSDDPGERIELLRRTYAPDEILGRQLVISMMPAVPAEAWPAVSFAGVRAFLPSFTVQDSSASAEELAALTVEGEALTLEGHRITVEDDGTLRVGDAALAGPDLPAPAASEVATLALEEIDSASFGDVTLRVRALDAGGQPVEGLAADAFELYEDDAPMGFLLRSNASAPRVHVLSDASGSMPPEYRGEAAQTFVDELTAEILVAEPRATFEFGVTNSDLWTALSDAAQEQPTLIIFLTDGHVDDELTPEIQAVLEAGPPAVMIGVNGSSTETLDQMAAMTGGVVVPASDMQDAVDQSAAFIAAQDVPPYLLTYAAPEEGPSTRSVRLATTSEVSTTGSYEVPAQPRQPRRLAGLYLTVRIGQREVTRTLAGNLHRTRAPVPAADLDDTRDALFGTTIVSFEGGLPTPSHWLDDVVSSKLSLQPLFTALGEGDATAAIGAFTGGVRHLPPELFSVHAPQAPSEDGLIFESGIRTTLYSERPRFGTDKVARRIDILPTDRLASAITGTEAERLERTLRATARTAIAEKTLFATSTASLLEGQDLFVSLRGQKYPFSAHPDLSDDEKARWDALLDQYTSDVRLLPATGRPQAYWSVDYDTGALLGILPDGSGGGGIEEQVGHVIQMVDKLAAYWNILATAAGTGVAIGLVINHGQLLARLYGAVTITISLLDASGLDEAIQSALRNFACNALKTIFLGAMGKAGSDWTLMENVVGLLTDSTAFSCPG